MMNILIIRFRQMGDAVLATVVCNTLKKNFPQCHINLVLNERICPLFEHHPSIDNLIPFTEKERHSTLSYLHKVWKTVHQKHYDVIIDMRSTLNTMPFAWFSPKTRFRIGLRKPYLRGVFTHRIEPCRPDESMIEHNLKLLAPLEDISHIEPERNFSLSVTAAELKAFRSYMEASGISFDRPIMLAGVTAKLQNKAWSEDNMVWVLQQFMQTYPDVQIIFNYAPGQEKENAHRIYERLGCDSRIFFDLQASTQRELVAMSTLISFYFGNEGGARHIVQACGKPSFVVCAPRNSKATWIPHNDIPADAVAASDLTADAAEIRAKGYALITKEVVWERWNGFITAHHLCEMPR